MKKTVFLLILAALASCEKGSESPRGRNVADLSAIPHDMIVLGDKLEDPYSIENVGKALKSLYPVKGSRIDVKPTDIYVRFLPSSDKELARLESLCPLLLDHPLDFEIIRDGDYYHDPGLSDDVITWQYAVVPAGFDMPEDIRYEILDECYIPDAGVPTRADGIDWDLVEREAFRLTGNERLLKPAVKGGEADAPYPSGRISIIDDKCVNGNECGVKGVKVCVNSFVKFASAYTDEDGNYTIDKKFSSDVRYRIVFENIKGFSIGVNLLLVNASMSSLGKNSPDGVTAVIDRSGDRKLFSRSVVNNAAYDYYSRCNDEDFAVSPPPENLRIWLFQKLGDSFTPMFQQGTLIDGDLISNFLGEYKSLVKMFLPDMLLGLKGLDDYSSIYATASHGLAQASHFMKAGKEFWGKMMIYELKSFASSLGNLFGAGTEKDSGYCEVCETWGFFMENVIYKDRYGNECPTRGVSHWFSPQILLYMYERGVGEGKIFSVLGPDINSRTALQSALSNNYPEHKSLINQAFERYQY